MRTVQRLLRDLDAGFLLRHRVRVSTWWRVGRHHPAPIEPLRTLRIDPRAVERWIDMEIRDYRRVRYRFDVRDGDWDLSTSPLTEHFVFASLEQRFVHGLPWEQTPLYAVALRGVHDGQSRYHGCLTKADLERRLQRLESLREEIVQGGYRSQSELRRAPAPGHRVLGRRPAELDEVVVAIDRHGGFILVDGVHRLSLARLGAVRSIPVIVWLRHSAWQTLRDDVARSGSVRGAPRNHPDVVGLATPPSRRRP